MKTLSAKILSIMLLLVVTLPLVAMAEEAAPEFKGKNAPLDSWLTISGDYRMRFDSLHGKTAAYTDVNATFANATNQIQGAFFASPPGAPSTFFPGFTTGQAVSGLMGFQQAMGASTTFSKAQSFVTGPNGALIPALGQFAVMVPAQTVKNDTMYTNRIGLNLDAKATKDVTVHTRLLMLKSTGSQDESAITGSGVGPTGSGVGPFFADRVGVFDGVVGHVPGDSRLAVDQAFATWKNIAGQPIWLSVGRRPSTGGVPEIVKQNNERPGNGGTPAMVIDFAFDGGTIGIAPDIDFLPGAYAKVCFGRGFDSGITSDSGPHLHDTDFLGVAIVPIDTDPLRIDFQWARGFNLFDFPVMSNTAFGNTKPSVNLGNIDWYELGAISTQKIGKDKLNIFGTAALSVTHPNDNVSANAGFEGLGTGGFFSPEAPTDKTGWGAWVGARYDVTSTRTKIGAEYNHGSKNWSTFAPAMDDLWTSKVGTRGNVYEGYVIQELPLNPVSSYISKAFFKLGYQYYDFEFTGSNNYVGAPVKISDIKPSTFQLTTPLKNAQDIYLTFEVKF